jgi:hypothetical protein
MCVCRPSLDNRKVRRLGVIHLVTDPTTKQFRAGGEGLTENVRTVTTWEFAIPLGSDTVADGAEPSKTQA